MHPMDRTYGRGLAAHPMPLTSHDYPPGVKSPAERWEEQVRADERAKVAREVAEDIARAIESHHAADDLTAIQDARIARHHATQYGAAPAESVVGAQAVGRCGDAMPSLVDVRPRHFCALPAGHAGWHRSDEGAEWTHGGPVGALPEPASTRERGERSDDTQSNQDRIEE